MHLGPVRSDEVSEGLDSDRWGLCEAEVGLEEDRWAVEQQYVESDRAKEAFSVDFRSRAGRRQSP